MALDTALVSVLGTLPVTTLGAALLVMARRRRELLWLGGFTFLWGTGGLLVNFAPTAEGEPLLALGRGLPSSSARSRSTRGRASPTRGRCEKRCARCRGAEPQGTRTSLAAPAPTGCSLHRRAKHEA